MSEAEKTIADAGKLILRRDDRHSPEHVSITALRNVFVGLFEAGATDREVVEALARRRNATTIVGVLTTDRDENVKASVVQDIVTTLIELDTATTIDALFNGDDDKVNEVISALISRVTPRVFADRLDTEVLLAALANRHGGYSNLSGEVVARAIQPELDTVRREIAGLTYNHTNLNREIAWFEGEVERKTGLVTSATTNVETAQTVADDVKAEVDTLEADFENVPGSFRAASEVFLNGRREALTAANAHVRTETTVLTSYRESLEEAQSEFAARQTDVAEVIEAIRVQTVKAEAIRVTAGGFAGEKPQWLTDAEALLPVVTEDSDEENKDAPVAEIEAPAEGTAVKSITTGKTDDDEIDVPDFLK